MTNSTKLTDIPGASEALPKKAEYGSEEEVVGRNMAIDELSEIHLEVDVEAMAKSLNDTPYIISMSLGELIKYLSDNIPKWARLVRK